MFMVMLIFMVTPAPVFLDSVVRTKYQQMSHAVNFFFKLYILVSWHFVRLNGYGSQTVAVKFVKKSRLCIYGNLMF
jgi:hypothetical protein